MEHSLARSAGAFLLALGTSVFLTWAMRRLALRRDWLKLPTEDRWHAMPTPTLGGIAFFLAFVLATASFALAYHREVIVLNLAAGGVFLLGLADDRRPMRPRWKLAGQLAAAVGLAWFGLGLQLTRIPALDLALTLLWIVGITNAFNLLDNMNGLSAGVAVIVAGFRSLLFLYEGQFEYAGMCAAFVGAVLGFLLFNFPTGRIFMGDAGSLFLGFWLAGVTLIGVYPYTRGYLALLFFPVLVMAVPILDTALVTVTRSLRGQAIAQGGKDHTSHRLVRYGFSEEKAVLLLWALSFAGGVIALSTTFLGVRRVIPAVVLLLLALAVFGTYLARLELSQRRGHRSAPAGVLRLIGIASTAVFDLILAGISYYSAFLLRFELDLPPGLQSLFWSSVAEISLIKLAVLIALGIYRGWWRYSGLEDGMRTARASVLATGVAMAYFFLFYRLEGFPRSVFFLDLLVFTLLLTGFRFSFRIMDRWAPLSAPDSSRVLIFGPDDQGELALQLVLRQRKLKVVGFLDRDDAMMHYKIHSVPVLGGVPALEELAHRHRVAGVVFASTADPTTAEALHAQCRRLGLQEFRAVLEIQPDRAHDTGPLRAALPVHAAQPATTSASLLAHAKGP